MPTEDIPSFSWNFSLDLLRHSQKQKAPGTHDTNLYMITKAREHIQRFFFQVCNTFILNRMPTNRLNSYISL